MTRNQPINPGKYLVALAFVVTLALLPYQMGKGSCRESGLGKKQEVVLLPGEEVKVRAVWATFTPTEVATGTPVATATTTATLVPTVTPTNSRTPTSSPTLTATSSPTLTPISSPTSTKRPESVVMDFQLNPWRLPGRGDYGNWAFVKVKAGVSIFEAVIEGDMDLELIHPRLPGHWKQGWQYIKVSFGGTGSHSTIYFLNSMGVVLGKVEVVHE